MEANNKGAFHWIQGGAFLPGGDQTPAPPEIQPPPPLCEDMVLVMSYVKMQQWDQTYEAETALARGTIFPDLDFPFEGEGACPHD